MRKQQLKIGDKSGHNFFLRAGIKKVILLKMPNFICIFGILKKFSGFDPEGRNKIFIF